MNSPLAHATQTWLVPLLLGALLVAFAVAIALSVRTLVRSVRARSRARRALRGERRAASLLAAHGYRVHDAQLSVTYHPTLSGMGFAVPLRADYLVSRRGRRYVAEVKTGARAPSLAHAPTRRQLLEYSVAFDVQGVLLVDVEAGRVQEVRFPRGPAMRHRPGLACVIAAVGALTAGTLLQAPRGGYARTLEAAFQRGRTMAIELWSRP
ncbi:MAG: hypothetical protein H6726_26880 [Sandaracinaceae bacterium]|nr:hypothetical protein [Sandaracinaceae bacterium]